MTLDVLTRPWEAQQDESDNFFGYKLFRLKDGKLYSFLMDSLPLPVGLWLNERDFRDFRYTQTERLAVTCSPEILYPSGWHVWLDIPMDPNHRGAYQWSSTPEQQLKKVLVRDITNHGSEIIHKENGEKYHRAVFVAKKIFITDETIT